MNHCRRVVLLAMVVALISGSALAQVQTQWMEYAAKFLCGTIGPELPPGAVNLGPGVYQTSINIRNPQIPLNATPLRVLFGKKAVISLPEGAKPLTPSGFKVDTLQPYFAEEVDCNIIRSLLGPQAANSPFIEGWVLILVAPDPPPKQELDVVGVYTVNSLQGQSISLEMTPITPRFFFAPLANSRKLQQQMMEQSKKP